MISYTYKKCRSRVKIGDMNNVLNITDNYIIILDKHFKIKFCNKKALLKIKYTLEDIENSKVEKILDIKNLDINKLSKDSTIKLDLQLYSKDIEKIPISSEILIENYKGEESIFIIAKDLCEKTYTTKHLEKILDNLKLNCWLKNMNGEYIFVNESYAKELKDNKLNILGKKTSDYWDEEACNLFTNMDKEVIISKKYQLIESYSKNEDSELWVETYKAPIFDENNEVEYILGSTRDITLNKNLDNKIFAYNKEINNLNNILMKSNLIKDVNDLLYNISESILNYFECDSTAILLVNKDKSGFDYIAECGIVEEYKLYDELMKIGLCNIDNFIEKKYLDTINNIKDMENEILRNYMHKNNIQNMGIYNIEFNGETFGYLLIKSLENNTLKFNKYDYLKTISQNTAIIIKSYMLSEELQEEFDKRKEIENQLKLFLDISVDLIATCDSNGKFEYVNKNWIKTLGWNENELLGMNILNLIHDDFKEKYLEIINSNKNDMGSITIKLKCADNIYKWVELNYKLAKLEDKLIITVKDISEQRKQEKERKLLEEAVQIESLKNEFFANISHEFRTPLNIILGTMQLMKRNIDNNRITWDNNLNLESHIDYIKQNSYRLLRLVNNLIDITSLDSGYYKLQLGNYNIVDIVENITLSVAQYIKDKGLNLIFDTNCEEKIISCDPDKIERIMLNLLSNAIKYSEENGNIYVELYADDDKIKVLVRDDGLGISEDKVDVIFDRFKRIDSRLNRKCEGSGIGLSLVKSLVELHQGNIHVKSKLGVGSEFTFEIPANIIGENQSIILEREISENSQIEKCNIEFSDIYS